MFALSRVATRVINSPLKANIPAVSSLSRGMSTTVEDPIVLINDGTTFVAWHPEKEFPYECTRPMPPRPVEEPSVLKVKDEQLVVHKLEDKKARLKTIEELCKITYTTKHRWFPRSRNKKAKKTPKDREYI